MHSIEIIKRTQTQFMCIENEAQTLCSYLGFVHVFFCSFTMRNTCCGRESKQKDWTICYRFKTELQISLKYTILFEDCLRTKLMSVIPD